MPIRWEADHAQKLVRVTGEGAVTLKDVETYLDQIVTAGAMPYAKLFDATKVDPKYNDHDIMMLAARMSAYRATMKGGPLVFVVAGGPTHEAIQRYINLAPAERAVEVFSTVPEAQAWLAAQPKADDEAG
jgi:hypothetical protein